MVRLLKNLLLATFVTVVIVVSYWVGQQAYSWMPSQATAEAKRVDELFSFLVTLGAFIFLGIVGFILYSILTYRAVKGDFGDGPAIEGNSKLEALWTGIPILLVLWIAAQSYSIYQQIDLEGLTSIVHLHHMPMAVEPAYAETVANKTKLATEEVEVIAQQWAWSFHYPARNITSAELHLPVNQSVRLVLQSKDVLHGFYVPEFRIKQDIIPNRAIDFVFTPTQKGKYRLRDSQFSGTYFALMQTDVYVESPEAHAQWLEQTTSAPISNNVVAKNTQELQKAIRSNWPTVLPAKSSVVNHSN
jgi:cytochrome c oxidase subunit 2